MLEIEGDYFLIYADEVYLQPPLPPDQTTIYQIASIQFIEYNKFVNNRQRDIFEVLQKVSLEI